MHRYFRSSKLLAELDVNSKILPRKDHQGSQRLKSSMICQCQAPGGNEGDRT